MTRLAFVAVLLLAGCAHAPTPPPEPIASAIVLSENLSWGASAWQREAAKRFDHPILLIVHGGTQDGQWCISPDLGPRLPVEGVARLLHKLYPKRPIVLLSCNADAHQLNVPNVFYSRQLVWSRPTIKPGGAGSIWQFEGAKQP